MTRLTTIELDVSRVVASAIEYIHSFDFLWRDDSQLSRQTIVDQDEEGQEITVVLDPKEIPSAETRKYLQSQLENLIGIEDRLNMLPPEIQIGCVCIETRPIIVTLKTFVYSWKTQYGNLLHKFARTELENVVQYRQQVQMRFKDDVSTLEQLDEALILLEELTEMENKIE